MKMKDGYVLVKSEWDIYHSFRPSFLQRIVWFFWPSIVYINWLRYKDVEREDCFD